MVSILKPVLLAATVFVLSRQNSVTMRDGTHTRRKRSMFIFSLGEERSFDEVILPGDPVFRAFSQRLV
jgi:hypothetical protein